MTHTERRQSWVGGWWLVGTAALTVGVAAALAAITGHGLLLTVAAGFASYPLVVGLVELVWSRWGRPKARQQRARPGKMRPSSTLVSAARHAPHSR